MRALRLLADREVGIIDARTVEDATAAISKLANELFREKVGIEPGPAIAAVVIDLERSGQFARSIEQKIVYPVAQGA